MKVKITPTGESAQLKAKEDKVNTLLELVEQDPEIKKRLDEVMLSKSK